MYKCKEITPMRLSFLLTLSFFVVTPLFGQTSDVSRWIKQLGSEEYREREEASENLKKSGFRAVPELQKALKDPDVEVVERARELLRSVEMSWIDLRDPPYIRELMTRYSQTETASEKFAILNALTDWSGNYGGRSGEGIGAICRILRFEQEPIVRAEAAREIIAVPPVRYDRRQHWFETVQTTLADAGDDFLLRMVADFANARDAALEYREAHLFEENPEPPAESIVRQVRHVAEKIHAFRENSEYSEGRRGTDTDILLFYALAELQDAIGLKEELDESLFQALDLHPVISEEDRMGPPYMAHIVAANYLWKRFFNVWAKKEFLMVAQKEAEMETSAYYCAGQQATFLGNDEQTAELFGIVVENLNEPARRANDYFGETPEMVKARHKYYLAKLAVDRGEIEDAKKLLDEAVQLRPDEIDCLILRYQIGNDDPEYKKRTESLINAQLALLKQEMAAQAHNNEQLEYLAQPFNQGAWLMANTDGNYEQALNAAKKALFFSPENPMYLDTLAHVYALGKEYDKAVESQKLAVKYSPQAEIFREALAKFEAKAEEVKSVTP